ncbi:MAG: hypothetical protein DIU67_000055 [Actinomycetes bacterium]|jgi:hypothetical protein|nr:MAG: hypothetical protein DIU67_08660 [Actinomycetota bacterium]
MTSPQTLSEADRRLLASWAADCAERVLPIFEAAMPGDTRPREAIERARSFAAGDLPVDEAIRLRFVGGRSGTGAPEPAAAAAARSAGQAAAVCHLGAHALGAAAYALRAVELTGGSVEDELGWQLGRLTPEMAAALRSLPPAGTDRSGPLGPGLLTRGRLGEILVMLQERTGSLS